MSWPEEGLRAHLIEPAQGRLMPAACARHFGMDAERWASMCERTSEHYRRVAGYRYDPAERLEKSRRYAEAADEDQEAACRPDQVGVPGVGVAEPACGAGARKTRTLDRSEAGCDERRASAGRTASASVCAPIIPRRARPASPGAAQSHLGPGIARRPRIGLRWRA